MLIKNGKKRKKFERFLLLLYIYAKQIYSIEQLIEFTEIT